MRVGTQIHNSFSRLSQWPRLGFFPLGRVERRVKRFARFDPAQPLAQSVLLVFAHQVLQAKLGRIESELFRDEIRVRLHGERERCRATDSKAKHVEQATLPTLDAKEPSL